MRLLLDTHVLLWLLTEPGRLRPQILAMLADAANEVLFSVVNIWEVAIKVRLQRDDFVVDPATVFQAARAAGLVGLPVYADAAMHVAKLPLHHRDPFDRLLIAQAVVTQARLCTADAQLSRYSDDVLLVT